MSKLRKLSDDWSKVKDFFLSLCFVLLGTFSCLPCAACLSALAKATLSGRNKHLLAGLDPMKERVVSELGKNELDEWMQGGIQRLRKTVSETLHSGARAQATKDIESKDCLLLTLLRWSVVEEENPAEIRALCQSGSFCTACFPTGTKFGFYPACLEHSGNWAVS